nr:hypothetical protein [Candidatus Sigynarchaeota archaeon]
MSEKPPAPAFDPLAGLGNIDRSKCGICGSKLTGASHLVNIGGQMKSICMACSMKLKKKK